MKNFQEIPKSQIFTREQLKAIRGGDDGYYGDGNCLLRCDQDSTTGSRVSDCSRATASASCSDLSKAICTC